MVAADDDQRWGILGKRRMADRGKIREEGEKKLFTVWDLWEIG